jgi:hypothetical protein
MRPSAVDSWLDQLSNAEEEQHLPSPVVSVTVAPASHKRQAEDTLKRQADQALQNYQALKPRSLELFLFTSEHSANMPAAARSGHSAKKQRTDISNSDEATTHPYTCWTPASTGFSGCSSQTRTQNLARRQLRHAIPAIASNSLEQLPPRGLAVHTYLEHATRAPYLPASL